MRRATLVAALGLLLVMIVGAVAEAAGPVFSASGSGTAGDILTVTGTVEQAAASATISASFTADCGNGPSEAVNLTPITGGDSGGALPASATVTAAHRDTARAKDRQQRQRHRHWRRWHRRHHHQPAPQPQPTTTWIATGYVPVPAGTPDGDCAVVVTFVYNGVQHVVQTTGHIGS